MLYVVKFICKLCQHCYVNWCILLFCDLYHQICFFYKILQATISCNWLLTSFIDSYTKIKYFH
ncbi:hypothetical protein HanIR_Chr01g0049221 [Helianthus annuus]|nr:hypothetical protein HanIR_Chr01g0049221 [Helianthus annuus]